MSGLDSSGARGGVAAGERQYLTFRLADEEYGLEILRVQEIKGYIKATPVPNAPPEVRGVMNLRGAVVPVIDLRARFGLPQVEYTPFTVIVVVTVGAKVIGLVVDAVSDVLNVGARDAVPAPDLGAGSGTTFLSGIARNGERLVSLLDLDRLVGTATPAA